MPDQKLEEEDDGGRRADLWPKGNNRQSPLNESGEIVYVDGFGFVRVMPSVRKYHKKNGETHRGRGILDQHPRTKLRTNP